jgi:CRISPR/Cas system-associated protein Cas5 (RAMP superfamily)
MALLAVVYLVRSSDAIACDSAEFEAKKNEVQTKADAIIANSSGSSKAEILKQLKALQNEYVTDISFSSNENGDSTNMEYSMSLACQETVTNTEPVASVEETKVQSKVVKAEFVNAFPADSLSFYQLNIIDTFLSTCMY